MKSWTSHLIVSGFILFTSLPVFAGHEGSGGSDYFRPARAWFLSVEANKKIQACYDVDPKFGLSYQELSEMVRTSFKVWGDYIQAKHLSAHLPPNSLKIVTQVDLSPKCKGDEDLKFYFGTDDMKVVKAKIQYYKPFGFAELYSDETPQPIWSPGFIWIANAGSVFQEQQVPNWMVAKESLRALILHEVGHVFGNGHVDDTVMTVHLAEYLTVDTDAKTPMTYLRAYSLVDSIIELIPCMDCVVSYKAPRQFDGKPTSPGNDDLSNAFRMLVGKDPIEPLSAQFNRSEHKEVMVKFTDRSGDYIFPIQVLTQMASKADSVALFNGLGGRSFNSYGSTYFGEIQPQIGAKIPVAINYNMDRRKVAIIPLGFDMTPPPLFVASP